MQRVSEASVRVGDEVVGECGRGLVVLLGVAVGDDEEHRDAARSEGRTASRLPGRGGPSSTARFSTSEATRSSSASSRCSRTRERAPARASRGAAGPDVAEPLYERFCAALGEEGVHVSRGVFGATMQVALVNDGPVTIVLEA